MYNIELFHVLHVWTCHMSDHYLWDKLVSVICEITCCSPAHTCRVPVNSFLIKKKKKKAVCFGLGINDSPGVNGYE